MKYPQLFLILAILLISACNTKKYIYVREDELDRDSLYVTPEMETYALQCEDVLYVSIHSTHSNTEGLFHFPGQGGTSISTSGGSSSMYLTQFVISDSGNITLPVIGKVYVQGSTVQEVEQVIQTEARKYIDDAMARVKLVSFRITFIGEFGSPGEYVFYKNKVDIFDALAISGEVNLYGDRKNLRVLRRTEEGIQSYTIDLTDKSLLTSSAFYLYPNDVVYAEPLPRRIFRSNVADYTLLLATITSTIAFITLMINLRN